MCTWNLIVATCLWFIIHSQQFSKPRQYTEESVSYPCNKLPEYIPLQCCAPDIFRTPFHCYFMTIEERKTTSDCNCLARTMDNLKADVNMWGQPGGLPSDGEDGALIEAWGTPLFLKRCTGVPKARKAACYPLVGDQTRFYPPTGEALGYFSDGSCFRVKNVYKYDLSCWLHDCHNRLKIPAVVFKEDFWKFRNCLPAVLPTQDHIKYCDLYTMTTDLYNESLSTMRYPTGCLLPPPCGPDGKIDTKIYMNPYISTIRKENNTYCEVICPKNANTGVLAGGQPCRRRPTCGEDDVYQVAHVEQCLEWCSVKESLRKQMSAESECNQRPICNENGESPPKYTDANPYAANSTFCVELPVCDDDHPASKFNCDPSFLRKHGKTLIIVGSVLLVLLIIVVVFIVVICLRKRKQRRQDPEAVAQESAMRGGPNPQKGQFRTRNSEESRDTAKTTRTKQSTNSEERPGQASRFKPFKAVDSSSKTHEEAAKTPGKNDMVTGKQDDFNKSSKDNNSNKSQSSRKKQQRSRKESREKSSKRGGSRKGDQDNSE